MFDYELKLVKSWIEKDRGVIDWASYLLSGGKIKADLILKEEEAVISGVRFLKVLLKDFSVTANFFFEDGTLASKGKIAELEGEAYQILTLERTILNLLSLLSAIATKTRKLMDKIPSQFKTKIAATRKVLPGLGYLQKMAVIDGGGDSHRWNLNDLVMIKDNHLNAYNRDLDKIIFKLREKVSFSHKIEIEVEDEKMAFLAAQKGADIIMLDNFSAQEAKSLARKLKKEYPSLLIEVSGGITEKNYLSYISPDIDVISMGRLTSELNYIDFSLELSEK